MAPTLNGKEEDRSKVEKKKTKSISGASPVKQSKPDNIYPEILAMEAKESESRPADKDAEMFSLTCNELRTAMKEILDIKTKQGQAKAGADIQEKRIDASLLFVTLKKLNRLEKLRIKKCRDETNSAKQNVDTFNLQLQNLLYEVLHLKKEVTKCINYKSADEAIDLVPVHKFYTEAKEDISKPEVTKTDAHLQRLARLEWELTTRKELDDECQSQEVERKKVAEKIKEKAEKMGQLGPQLKTILSATKPVQEYLSLPLDHQRSQNNLARLLPSSLYILFTQAQAYSQACDSFMEVGVEGDEEEARQWREEGARSREEDEEDQEDVREEDEDGKKKRRSAAKDKMDEKKKKVLKKHPLNVKMEIKTKEGDIVICRFNFLLVLRIVTVETKLSLKEGRVEGEVLQAANLLEHLFEGDDGQNSPNPSTLYQLKKAGLESLANCQDIGVPYVWAQRLAGMDFLAAFKPKDTEVSEEEEAVKVDPNLSHLQMENTVKGIRARLEARLALQKQLNNLEKAKLQTVDLLPAALCNQFPARVSSKLKGWNPISWEAYGSGEATKHFVQHGVVDQHDFYYKAQCNRETVSLVALVAIKPDYPISAPIFCINLHHQGEHNVHNNEWIRDLEREVNIGWKDQVSARQVGGDLLTVQLYILLVLLDVLLEAGSQVTGANDFPKEKVFFSAVRGRMRSMPFLYSAKQQIFQHR